MIEMTDDVRRVLSCRSTGDKISVPIDCEIAPVSLLPVVSMLVREGVMVWIDRCSLQHLVVTSKHDGRQWHPNVDIYKLTARGIALCEWNGIKQH